MIAVEKRSGLVKIVVGSHCSSEYNGFMDHRLWAIERCFAFSRFMLHDLEACVKHHQEDKVLAQNRV